MKIIFKLSKKFNLYILLKLSGISESGYYKYRNNILNNNTKEDKEKEDYELIKNLVLKFNRKYGYRKISMEINKNNKNINHKKVLRIMKKYGLLAKIRRKNPYKNIAKANQEHKTSKNILNREFRGIIPLQKLGTDITYIKFKGKWSYFSMIKDMITGEILSSQLSQNLGILFVQNTIKQLEEKYRNTLKGVILHSDQGFHYTHPDYHNKLK